MYSAYILTIYCTLIVIVYRMNYGLKIVAATLVELVFMWQAK